MSFGNTKTPKKPVCKPKYTVPTRAGKRGTTEFYLTPELEKEFRRLFPITPNPRMMQLFGLSHATLHRFARALSLQKDMKVIKRKQAAQIKKKCEANGWYDSLRGRRPSQQCLDAYQEYLHSDRYKHPLVIMKEHSIRKYNNTIRRRSETRKHLFRTEKMRKDAGIRQHTRFHIPDSPYTRKQVSLRYNFKNDGYILGSYFEEDGERLTVFYDSDTHRNLRREKHALTQGFTILPLN